MVLRPIVGIIGYIFVDVWFIFRDRIIAWLFCCIINFSFFGGGVP